MKKGRKRQAFESRPSVEASTFLWHTQSFSVVVGLGAAAYVQVQCSAVQRRTTDSQQETAAMNEKRNAIKECERLQRRTRMRFASDAQSQHGAEVQDVTGCWPGCRSSVFEQRSVGDGHASPRSP